MLHRLEGLVDEGAFRLFQFLLGCYRSILLYPAEDEKRLSIPFRMLLADQLEMFGLFGFQFLLGCYSWGLRSSVSASDTFNSF